MMGAKKLSTLINLWRPRLAEAIRDMNEGRLYSARAILQSVMTNMEQAKTKKEMK